MYVLPQQKKSRAGEGSQGRCHVKPIALGRIGVSFIKGTRQVLVSQDMGRGILGAFRLAATERKRKAPSIRGHS